MSILTTENDCSISPSVYVAYRNLRRSDNCPSFGWGDFTRGTAYNTTIAYNPGFLSTSMCTGEPEGFYQGFAALNLTDLQYPIKHNGTCEGLDISMESTTNGPYLSMPPALTGVDPAWSTCIAVYWGAFDPPIALHTATALVQDPGNISPPTPAPGSPVAPPHAPPTPTTSTADPISPEKHSSAPETAPQDPNQQNPNPPDPINTLGSDTPSPDASNPDPPDPFQPPANHNNGDPAASAALANPLNEGNVAQGNSKATSVPQSNDPQRAGDVSKGDPEADPGNENNTGNEDNAGNGNNVGNGDNAGDGGNASPTSDPATNVNQGPADRIQPLPSIGGHQIQAASGGGILVASTTLQAGLQTTIDGTPLSIDKDRIIIASSTIPLTPPPSAADPIITLVNGDVISAGGPAAVVSGTTIAYVAPHDDGGALVINGHTSPLPQPVPTAIPLLTVAGQTITPAPTGFVLGGQSVLPGGPVIVVHGSTISLASNALIVNGKTTPLPTSVFKVGSQTFTAAPTGFAVGGQSVIPGGPAVVVDGSTFSLAPSGTNPFIVINGKTTSLLASVPTSVFRVGSQLFTAAPTGFAVGAQSVRPGGPAVTVDGTVVSLDASSELIVGTSTVPLARTQDGALGSLIMYGVGGGGGGARATNVSSANASDVAAPFLGKGRMVRGSVRMAMLALGVDIGIGIGVLVGVL